MGVAELEYFGPTDASLPGWLDTRRNLAAMLGDAWENWRAPERHNLTEWSDKYRYLSPAVSAEPGKYRSMRTPWVRGQQAALSDPMVEVVVNMKAAQTAWTDGVIVNYLLQLIDEDPCGIIGLFAKKEAAEDFVDEKFAPAVRVTPRVRDKIDVTTSRRAGNKKTKKNFPGGFLKLVGSNSTSSVKSTTARVLFVEEPDDANDNIKGQGDAITLLKDRNKTFEDGQLIFGGTPTIKGVSSIEAGYNASDRRMYFVPCHECGESHVLDWDNVKWLEDSDSEHEVFGRVRFDSVVYSCPHCGALWDDEQKNKNVQAAESTPGAGWQATAPFNGIAGFGFVSELYAPFHASRFSNLLKLYLEAQHELKHGDDTKWIAFVNTRLGRPYEFSGGEMTAEALRDRGEDYAELSVPDGGLAITAGIDVQHDRLAVVLRAWGRENESWLIYWGELAADVKTGDDHDAVWVELEKLVYQARPSVAGYQVPVLAVSIDSSDGGTNDAVYSWVRRMQRRYPAVQTMPVKGASDTIDKEIFSRPRESIDSRTPTKADRHGLRVYMVGTNKAKDLFFNRLDLTGVGPGRVHFYADVRADYHDQITAEIKAPSRRHRGRRVYQKKSGRRNEALDCEVYALHGQRSVRLHLRTAAQWDGVENELRQADLFAPAVAEVAQPAAADTGGVVWRSAGGDQLPAAQDFDQGGNDGGFYG